MIVSRHLVEPAHHVPLELRLVLAGRLPAVAPGGGHVLAHRVPVWVYSIVFFLVISGECPVSLHTHVPPVVVAGHALVSPPLRHHGQLLVPHQLPVCRRVELETKVHPKVRNHGEDPY